MRWSSESSSSRRKREARKLCDACSASMTGVTKLRLEAQLVASTSRAAELSQSQYEAAWKGLGRVQRALERKEARILNWEGKYHEHVASTPRR